MALSVAILRKLRVKIRDWRSECNLGNGERGCLMKADCILKHVLAVHIGSCMMWRVRFAFAAANSHTEKPYVKFVSYYVR